MIACHEQAGVDDGRDEPLAGRFDAYRNHESSIVVVVKRAICRFTGLINTKASIVKRRAALIDDRA
ncbi:hypothetical protein OIV83_003745 [Microbotryomycetes sp. JL201]|nr:hypothetical protein OIV83_003745 [Microbotryomycetes sp. JL201]